MAPFLKNFSIIKKYEHLKPFSIDFKEGNLWIVENKDGKTTKKILDGFKIIKGNTK